MTEDIYKSFPCSEEAEKAILSCILKLPDKLDDALDTFSSEWFYVPSHSKIYEAMKQVAVSGVLDLMTLCQKLDDDGLMDEVGGRSEVAALLDDVTTASFFDHYAKILKEKYQLRQIIKTATDIVQDAYDNPENTQALADSAVESMARVADCVSQREEMPTMKERSLDAIIRYQAASEKGALQGLSTGLPKLDKMTGGFLDGDLVVIGARPSFGKTAFMTQTAGQICVADNNAGGIFSGEMSGAGLTDRFFSQLASVNLRDLNGGEFNKRDFDRLMREAKRLAASNLVIDDRAGLTISEIRRAGRRMKHKQGVKIIFLDYLQRFRADTQKENSDERARYAAIAGGLKDMAKELSIPVVVLAQLGRKADDVKAVNMNMSYIEGCSKIEQDADLIGFLGLPIDDDEPPDIFRDVDFCITKQRCGPCGNIPMRFRKSHTTFSEKVEIE